jgi:hypothetical protein
VRAASWRRHARKARFHAGKAPETRPGAARRRAWDAIGRVTTEPPLRAGIHAIAESFRAAGGYPKAADEVFAWKMARGIH